MHSPSFNFLAVILILGILVESSLASPLRLMDRLGEDMDRHLVQMRRFGNLLRGSIQPMALRKLEDLQNENDSISSSSSSSSSSVSEEVHSSNKAVGSVIPIISDIERLAQLGEILLNVGEQIIPILLQNLTIQSAQLHLSENLPVLTDQKMFIRKIPDLDV